MSGLQPISAVIDRIMARVDNHPERTLQMPKPTCEQLFDDDGYLEVDETLSPWCFGTYRTTVFRREADGTYWKAKYRVSSNEETHGLRDGDATISQCWPHEKTVIVYTDAEI